jgi:hypothetical protein
MTSDATKRALEAASKKAGVGEPYAPPNNTTRDKLGAMRAPAGFTPAPPTSNRQFDAPGIDPGPDDLTHFEQGARLAAQRKRPQDSR